MTRSQKLMLDAVEEALDADPFAQMLIVAGKHVTRAEARRIEREMWAVYRAERLAA